MNEEAEYRAATRNGLRLGSSVGRKGQRTSPELGCDGQACRTCGRTQEATACEPCGFGVKATDAPTYAVVALLLTGIGTLASFLPAYRATLVDPITTLRDE